jgi:hypothetical protein
MRFACGGTVGAVMTQSEIVKEATELFARCQFEGDLVQFPVPTLIEDRYGSLTQGTVAIFLTARYAACRPSEGLQSQAERGFSTSARSVYL